MHVGGQQVRVGDVARNPSEAPPLPASRRRCSIAGVGELRRIRESYRPLELAVPATTVSEDGLPSGTAASSRAGGVNIVVSALIVVFVRRLRRYRTHRVTANTDENVGVDDNTVSAERRADVGNSEEPAGEVQNAGEADLPADPAPPIQPLPESIRLLLLATFARLPRCLSAVRPLPLARSGFFYVGGRLVRCYYCGTDVPLLGGRESSTLEQHGRLSPGCLLSGPGHPQSVTAARSVLFLASRGVRVRRAGVDREDDMNINWR